MSAAMADKAMSDTNDLNVLQRHVTFFDQNHDGIIYPAETFQG